MAGQVRVGELAGGGEPGVDLGHRQPGSATLAPATKRIFRRSASAPAPPRGLGLALITAADFPSSTAAPRGREASPVRSSAGRGPTRCIRG